VVLDLGAPTNGTLGAGTQHVATITDDDDPPVVTFQSASQSADEGSALVATTATVEIDAVSGLDVTIPFTVSGTATVPDDVTVSSSPVVITAGQLTATIDLTIVEDLLHELDETVVLDLGAPTNGTLGAVTEHTLTITDDDAAPAVDFTTVSQSSAEGAGLVTATVQLDAVSGLDVTVPFSVSGTAVVPDDATVTASPVVITAGQLTAAIEVTIVQDLLDETAETVVLGLGAPTNGTLGASTQHTLTIDDDDDPPVVTFALAAQDVPEASPAATVDVVLSAASGFDVTIPFTLSGTATSGVDFNLDASPVVVPAGQTGVSLTLVPVQDSILEVDETVVIDLGMPTNGTLGAPSSHTSTILDDDTDLTSDDFNKCEGLSALWTYVDPFGDGSFSVTGVGTDDAWLRLTVPAGSDHQPYGSVLCARVEQPFNGADTQFRVRFDNLPTLAIQNQGLLVIEDDQRWLRFDIYHDGTQLNAFVGSTVAGLTSSEENVALGALAAPVELRLTRVGDNWTAEWSSDGLVWNSVVVFPFAINPTCVGVFGGNAGGAGAPAHEAVVDFFEAASDPLFTEDGFFPGAGPYILDVFTTGSGTGGVTLDPDQPDYLCTDVVALTAVPDVESAFVRWEGDITGTDNPVQVTMSGDRSVTAVFGGIPPVISNVQVTPTPTGAVVTWDTDEPATSRVDYGATNGYGSFEEDLTLVMAHSVVLSGLSEGTTYHFQICSSDFETNQSCTTDGTFDTPFESGLVSDDFNHCDGLLAPWVYLDAADGNYQVVGVGTDDAQVYLHVPGGSDHDPYDAGPLPPRIGQPVFDVDFEFEVKFESSLDSSIQSQGVLIEQDADDWIRFDLYHFDAKLYAFVGSTNEGSTAAEANVEIAVGVPMYLRVTRQADEWTMAWSGDAVIWNTVVNFPRPMIATRVAIYGGNSGGVGAPAHTAIVDWFQDTAKPLGTEDGTFPGSGPFTLTKNVTGNGSVTGLPDQLEYMCTDVVTLTAVPDAAWEFDHWEGDLGGNENPTQLAMTSDRSVTGVFTPDVTAPTISNLQVVAGQTTALVTWDTDEAATSRVEYGLDAAYGFVEESLALVTSHSVHLTGLTPETLYHFRACSTDDAGMTGCTADGSFATQAAWGFISDDFNQCSGLSANWTFVDPLADTNLDVVGVGTDDAWMRLHLPSGVEHQAHDVIYAPHVKQPVNDTDFQLEVKFDSAPIQQFQIQGVLVLQGPNDWLRFDIYHDGAQVRVYAGETVGSVTSELSDVGVGLASAPLWMRITRAGNLWTQEFSVDGSAWVATLSGVTRTLNVSEVALYGGNAIRAGSPSFVAVFDYAFDTEGPVVPEDGAFGGSGPFTLTKNVDPAGAGTILSSPDQPDYFCTDQVQVTAAPNPGWRFDQWTGDLSGSTNPGVLAMSVDRSVTAYFVPDPDPPVISDVQISPGPTFAAVTWTTDEPADSTVLYGPTSSYGSTEQDATLVTSHVVHLTGLTPNTTYHLQVCSADLSSNMACSGDYAFTTTPESGVISDDFNHPNVGLGLWTYTDPHGVAEAPRILGPCTSDALLELRVPQGTEYLAWIVNEHLRLGQPILDLDFEIEVKLETDFTSKYQSAGVFVEQDADTWLRFSFQHTGSSLQALCAAFDGGVVENTQTITILNGDWIGQPLWMRVQRVGDQWTQSYSLDGTTFFANGAAFSFACSATAAGVMAGNELPENNALEARFDYIFNTVSPISPEDFGCPSDATDPLQVVGGRPASDSAIRVEWTTDEETTSSLSWGISPGVYDLGTINGDPLVYADQVVVPGLLAETIYHFQVTSVDASGNTTISADVPLTTGGPGFDGLPDIDIWYGTTNGSGEPVLRFGHLGHAQTWCNIAGRVTDDLGQVVSLDYTLDNGSQVLGPFSLSVEGLGGLDVYRLVDPGDFNVELDQLNLTTGLNEVVLTAADNDGNVAIQSVWVDYTAVNTWPLPYSIDWNTVTDLQSAAQFIDGWFELDASSGDTRLRNRRDGAPVYGYDRLFAVGDQTWTDYEFLFDFEVHSLNPAGFTPGSNSHAFGVIMRWPGHNGGVQQPQEQFFPIGGLMAYRWFNPFNEHWQAYSTNYSPNVTLPPFNMPVEEGLQYVLKGQVEDQPNGDTLYRIRMWEILAPEPSDWFLEMIVPAGGQPDGSLLFIVHDVEASIGNISFTPL
jgi:regulation of enolase protein 1 (concanavalin A-like superfamily)